MSSHGKPEEHLVYDYGEAVKSNQDEGFQFSQPSSLTEQLSIPRTHHSHATSTSIQAPYAAPISSYPSRDSQSQGSPFTLPASRAFPIITSYPPRVGAHGSVLRIGIKCNYDLSSGPALFFSIMFGAIRRQATVKKEPSTDEFCHYSLETEVPSLDSSRSPQTQVPLYLHFEDEYGQTLGAVEVGDFMLSAPTSYTLDPFSSTSGRKRKLSLEQPRSPPKRSASQHMMDRMRTPSVSHQSVPTQASPYLRSVASVPYGLEQHFHHPTYSPRPGPEPSFQYPVASYAGQSVFPSPGVVPVYTQASRSSSLTAPPHPASTMAIGLPSSTAISAPTLVRTSSITASTTPSSIAGSTTQPFNPYAIYPNAKAVLKISGDLNKMADDWTEEEWDAKRRLVQFQRSQTGSTISTEFEPVSPEQRTPNSICISCIWWEERNECFVTSVDTIYLLESLVAVRFTVEEKNRIRRNLEGFRPLTVSKAKAESEEFFKVIMGFPNPKPRNIEKDVKVFPWTILSHALKKIIGKYSASYSSTAGALLTPAASAYTTGARTTSSEAGTEQQIIASPGSASSSTASYTHRARSMTNTLRSPKLSMPASGPTSLELRASANSQQSDQLRGQDYLGIGIQPGLSAVTPTPWLPHQPMPQYASLGSRQPWDLSTYMPGSPANAAATPATAQNLEQYYRTPPGPLHGPSPEVGQDLGAQSYDLYGGSTSASRLTQRTSEA